ncbi:MAG: arylsulfatase [Opitutus sp.]|nr:arylsulfatase [Opitutus sp.]
MATKNRKNHSPRLKSAWAYRPAKVLRRSLGNFWAFLWPLALWFGFGVASAAPAERPNIVYILADDLGIGDVSCFSPASKWRTPNLDRLAAQGLMFTDAHAASALCTPSRYAFLTGRYAWRGALKQGVLNGYDRSLVEPGRLTLPEFLRTQGYATAMFGKWHLGVDWERNGPNPEDVNFARPFGGGPLVHGFERFFGISASLDMPPYVWLDQNQATMVPAGRVTDSPPPKLWRAGPISTDLKMEEVEPRLIAKATAYLAERGADRKRQPFFLYLALAAPHTPLLPTPEFEGKTHTTLYGDFVTQVDADVGQVLAALENSGRAQNTIVIFTADNGFAPAAGLAALEALHHRPSAGFRGYKSDLFEGGHRIPYIARWPGHTPAGGRTAELVGQLDFFAACAELLGVRLPDNAAEDSVSLLPLLRGEKPTKPLRAALVHHSGEGRFTIREGQWKLLLWPGSGGWSSPTAKPSQWLSTPVADLSLLPPFQLHDLAADPAEQNNVAAAHPEIVQRLGRLMRRTLEQGRSTPGAPQPVTAAWPETEWMASFAP